MKILVDLLNVLFSNTQLPLTSLPVNCKHAPFQARSLQNHGELLTAIGFVMYCVVRLSALYMDQKRAWVEHATYLKMRNGNGAHQDPCQKTYLLFPNISLPLTSLPVNCKHSPFQAPSLPNDQVRRSE